MLEKILNGIVYIVFEEPIWLCDIVLGVMVIVLTSFLVL